MKNKSLVNIFLTACISLTTTISLINGSTPWTGKNVAFAQVTSDAFKKDASAATSKYNNVNYACSDYAKALYGFVKPNAAKYKIASYKIYKMEVPSGLIMHDDYSTKTAITLNGVHYYLAIDGYGFDNHHSTGKAMDSFFAGFVAPSKPKITEITVADLTVSQC